LIPYLIRLVGGNREGREGGTEPYGSQNRGGRGSGVKATWKRTEAGYKVCRLKVSRERKGNVCALTREMTIISGAQGVTMRGAAGRK